jgi:hypothetical protein
MPADHEKCDIEDSDDKLFDITRETELVTDIRNILDELNVISCVIFDQKAVIDDMAKVPLPSLKDKKRHALGYVDKVLASVNKMKFEAQREYNQVRKSILSSLRGSDE